MNNSLTTGGNTMVAPMFLTVGDDQQFNLKDLSVSGYTAYDPEEETGGTGGQVTIKILAKNGAVDTDENGKDKSYSFYDNGKTVKLGKGWYQGSVVSADNKVTDMPFDIGQGFWIYNSKAGLKVQTPGQVGIKDVLVPLTVGGNTPTGNPFPVNLTISDFSVTGYTAYDPEEETGGTGGQVTIKILAKNGAVDTDENGKDKSYSFYDNGKTVKLGKGWYQGSIVSADNKVTTLPITAGQGLWVYNSKSGLKLKVTAPASITGVNEEAE